MLNLPNNLHFVKYMLTLLVHKFLKVFPSELLRLYS